MLLLDRRAKSGGGIQQHDKNLLLSSKENYRQCKDKEVSSQKASLLFVESFTFFERVFPPPCLVPAAGRRIPNPSGGRRGGIMLGACALQALPPPFRLLPKFPTASSVSMPGWLALSHTTTLTNSHQKHNVSEGRRGMMRYRQEIRDQSKKK